MFWRLCIDIFYRLRRSPREVNLGGSCARPCRRQGNCRELSARFLAGKSTRGTSRGGGAKTFKSSPQVYIYLSPCNSLASFNKPLRSATAASRSSRVIGAITTTAQCTPGRTWSRTSYSIARICRLTRFLATALAAIFFPGATQNWEPPSCPSVHFTIKKRERLLRPFAKTCSTSRRFSRYIRDNI